MPRRLSLSGSLLACALLLQAPLALAQAPLHDECTGAIPLALGANGPYSNAGATDSAPAFCQGLGRDVWFSFVPPPGQLIRIRVCPTSVLAVGVEVFEGDCGQLRSLACTWDSCSVSNAVFLATPTLGRLLLRAGTFSGQVADFSVEIAALPLVANDECASALPVRVGSNGPFSNAGASPSQPAWGCFTVRSDVWFSFVPSVTGDLTLDVCGSSGLVPIAEIFDGTCASPISRACERTLCANGELLRVNVVAGRTVLIRVGGRLSSIGNFSLDLREQQAPPNDECVQAAPISNGRSGPFTLAGAALSEPWPNWSFVRSDVWFRYRASLTGELLLTPCFTPADTAVVQAFRGDCAQRTSTALDAAYCEPERPVRIPIRSGELVLLRVGSYGDGLSFTLDALEVASPPNDECSGAATLFEGENGPYIDAGSSSSGPLSCSRGVRDLWFRFDPLLPESDTTFELCYGLSGRAAVEAYGGTCAAPQLLACRDATCSSVRVVVFPTSSGTALTLRLATENERPLLGLRIRVTERPRISSRVLATGCGGASLRFSGVPAPGQQLRFEHVLESTSIPAFLLLGLERAPVLPICPGEPCALGVDVWNATHLRSVVVQVPYTPWITGASFAVQGISFGNTAPGCAVGAGVLRLTDTVVTVFP
jgi:hypothetical protein